MLESSFGLPYAYANQAIKKTIEKLGLRSYKRGAIEKLGGVATAPLVVKVDDVKFVVKIHPEIVPLEIRALKCISQIVPVLAPKVLYADVQKGILVMPFYPWPTLHEIIWQDFPRSVKEQTFGLCYSGLINVLYEATMQLGHTDPYEAYMNRIVSRLATWENSGELLTFGDVVIEPKELLEKNICINGFDLVRARNLIAQLGVYARRFTCTYKVGTHGDPILPNFLCEFYPPYRYKLIDWPNYTKNDPGIDLGKILHWNHVYGRLYQWWKEGKQEDYIRSELKLEVKKTSNRIEVYYDFPSSDLVSELDTMLTRLFKDFGTRHNDKNWPSRMKLGKVRADLGSVGIWQPYPTYKLVLFIEGILTLHRLMSESKVKGGDEDASLSIRVLDKD